MQTRTFNLSDAKMIQFSGAYRLVFLSHQGSFSGFDADFASPYGSAWESAINDSIAAPTEESRNDIQAGFTSDVQDAMKKCRNKYHEAAYFVRKAFPNNPSVQGLFGLNDYDTAAQSQATMRLFMDRLWDTAENVHKAPLLTAGYTQAKIDEMATLRDGLGLADNTQDHFSMMSPAATEKRIKTHNNCWSYAQRVNAAAKVIFIDDLVLYNLFLFPRRTEQPDLFNVIGTASEIGTGNLLEGVAVSIASLGLTTTTDEDGNYGFAGIAAGSYPISFSKAGYMPFNTVLNVVDPNTPTAC